MRPGPKPKADNALKPIRGVPPVPEHLGAIAKAKWAQVCVLLDAMNVLSVTDTDVIELYCAQYQVLREAQAAMELEGRVLKGRFDQQKVSPWVQIEVAALKQMTSLLSQMGLTPAARAKVNAAPPELDIAGEFAEFVS